jgi:hypothetical protein
VKQAFTVLKKIEAEGGVLSINTIMNLVTQASTSSKRRTFKLLLYLPIFIWIVAIGEAYTVEKKKDKGIR